MPAFLIDPVPHEEAAAFVRGLPAVSRQVFDGLLPDLKAFAFTITGIEKIEVLQNAREAIAKLPEGADWGAVKGELLDIISPYMRSTEDAERRAELLLRMHGGRAYAIAAWRAQQEDADIFPYVMWQTMGDGRVRDAHRALNGRVFRLDSDFIKEHYPPDGWNCRCQAVSMSEYDVRELREADAELPPHQRRVLDGPVLREVEQGERIPDPDRAGSFVSLRRPEGSPGWKPGQLQIPLDAMRAKYDPDIWAQFEREARSQRIDERGQTVWEWLEQATSSPSSTPAPSLKPAPTGTPFADTVKIVNKRGGVRADAEEAIAAIESVHGDGQMPRVTPIASRVSKKHFGCYKPHTSEIDINPQSPHPLNTICHELGHKIDFEAVRPSADPAVRQAMNAVIAACQPRLAQLAAEARISAGYKNYATKAVEAFARSYAQYIAQESGNIAMLAELETTLTQPLHALTQWEQDDFAANLIPAFRALFVALGWQQPLTPP